MPRKLSIRPPTLEELDQVHEMLEQSLSPWQRRRLEAVLLYAAGHNAADIAAVLAAHVNTIYSDLRCFHYRRGRAFLPQRRVGAPPRLRRLQRQSICRLAQRSPAELGLPYGRWSLSTLRDYLIAHRIVGRISREHLRRVLKKGGTRSAASPASCGARTPTAGVSSTGSESCGSAGLTAASCCFST
jgi:transposase